MLRLEVLPSSWSQMQDCTSIEGLPRVELDTLIVARWAHGLVPLFYLAILRHLCWMYWLCSFLVLSSYCGLVRSSDVLLTSKVQEYTITMENPAIPGSKSLQTFGETSPSLARCEVSSVVFRLVKSRILAARCEYFQKMLASDQAGFSEWIWWKPLKKLPSQNSIAFQALFWKAMLNFRGVDLKHLPIISTLTNCLDTSLKWW